MTLSTDFREVGPELIVTPFDPYYYEGAQDSRMWAEQQPLVSDGPEAEMFPLHRLSSTTPAALPLPGTPIPVGLSDKEIARLRAEGFNSQQPGNLGVSSSNVLQSMSSPNAVPESQSREAPYDPRRLYSEVENLVRREMERLHAEGLVVGSSPPSYTEGGRIIYLFLFFRHSLEIVSQGLKFMSSHSHFTVLCTVEWFDKSKMFGNGPGMVIGQKFDQQN